MSTPPDAPQPPPQGPYGPPPGQGSDVPASGPDPYAAPGQVQPYGPPGRGPEDGRAQGQGYGQGYGVQPDPGPPTDVVSVLGLVLAVLLAPVGLVLSIVGIVRTRDGKRKGRGFAIAGIIVSVVLSLLLAAALVALVAFGSWFSTELERSLDEVEQQPGFEELDEGFGVPSPGGPAVPADA